MLGALRDGLRETFVGGARLWRVAIWIPLLAALPEGAQHVWEVTAGMFDSRAAFKALAMDETRWAFGYAKIAGLLLAVLAAALWRGRHAEARGPVLWPRFAGALALNVLAGVALLPLRGVLAPGVFEALNVALSVATLPLLLYLLGALFGDAQMTLRHAFTQGWMRLPLMAVLLVAAFVVGQLVHTGNHYLAMGRPAPLVWALMAFDTLWVGTMACWIGSALAAGYAGRRP